MSSQIAPPANGSRLPRRTPSVAFAIGFRPFYLAASVFAALAVPLWAAEFAGAFHGVLRSPIWHGHEMLFGFTTAVVAGFLFTAVRNWTGQPTPTGAPLMAFALLWVAGRVLVLTPFAVASAIVNAAFPAVVAAGIAVPIYRSRNRRNYFFHDHSRSDPSPYRTKGPMNTNEVVVHEIERQRVGVVFDPL